VAFLVSAQIATKQTVAPQQGDQIGRIFAYWAVVYFCHFLEKYRCGTNYTDAFFLLYKSFINFDKTWGRCYDHNFLQFFPIFGKKIGVFLENQCHDQFFSKFSFVLSQKRQLFANFFGENI
jgi:hypothetical protein